MPTGIGIKNSLKQKGFMNKKSLAVLFEAMYHGKYDFEDFIKGDISSEYEPITLKGRTVYKTTKKLKTFHSFLSLFLFEYLDINDRVVFSYRKGFNAFDAVSKHAQSKFFYQTDIENFFHSLSTPIVKRVIASGIGNCPISDADTYLERIVDLVVLDNSLPLGFSSSPILSNSCLFEFDNELESYCAKKDLILTRYSDDIIVSGQSKESISGINEVVSKILENKFTGQLSLNDQKSKFTRKGNKVKLLGLVILPNGKVTIDIKIKNEIETLIYYYINKRNDFLSLEKVENDLSTGMDLIFGYLNYVNTVDKEYLDKLRKKFGATTIDMFLHKSAK